MGSQFSAKRRAPHQISPPYPTTAFVSRPFPSRPEILIPIDRRSEGSLSLMMAKNHRKKRIDVLPDDVLLVTFDFYVNMYPSGGDKTEIEAWQSLVHVCRRWRNLVFGSPRRLNLQLYCSPKTPARDTLDIWPALPLIVRGSMALASDTDNIIAALEQSNRVCKVFLVDLAGWQLEKVLAAMVPFPELTDLRLISDGKTVPVIPDSFFDGSAPRLRRFELDGILFPGLPKLALSANHLVQLWLSNIPHSGYISPEAIVALISVLSSLEILCLGFRSPQSRPGWESRSLPPPKRSILPALHVFRFKGVTEYLEDIVTFIDTPQLEEMDITFFNQIDFDTPRLAQFINRTPTLSALDEVHVQFHDSTASVELRYQISKSRFYNLAINISCREPDWQLSSIEQVCNSSLHPLSTVEDLYIAHQYSELVWKNDAIENTLWLQLLLPFTAVKNLYLFKEFAPGIAAALQELVGARITEVLPSLQNIFVEGLEPFQENVGQFVAARQLSDRPMGISTWDHARLSPIDEPPHPVDVKISWRGIGKTKTVFLARAGDAGWKGRQAMERSSSDPDTFTTTVPLLPGTHHVKFTVDDNWRLAQDLPTAVDDDGSLSNYVTVPLPVPLHH